VVAHAHNGGGLANKGGRRGAGDAVRRGAADRWGRAATGLVVSDGVWEEERKARQCGGRAPTGGPGPHSAGARFKLGFKPIQKYSNDSNEI
jgi:hypothetical protein